MSCTCFENGLYTRTCALYGCQELINEKPMTYEEAIQKAMTSRWERTEEDEANMCIIRPVPNGTEWQDSPFGTVPINIARVKSAQIAEHIVNLHNEILQRENYERDFGSWTHAKLPMLFNNCPYGTQGCPMSIACSHLGHCFDQPIQFTTDSKTILNPEELDKGAKPDPTPKQDQGL
jgi:hypothetical protein